VNALVESVILVGGGVLFSVVGLIVVRRTFRRQDFKKHHEIAGYLISVVGTLYSILLGLIVVNVQSKFDESREMAQAEASSCSDIANVARGLSYNEASEICRFLKWYYVVVQSEDWERIAEGRDTEASIPPYQGLWRAVAAVNPTNNRETSCYSALLDSMKRLSDARRYRMSARKRGLSIIVWLVLCVGAVMIILFTYFFRVESARTQTLLTMIVALFVSLNLLLVKLFENPYRNELLIKRGAFYFKPSVFDMRETRNMKVITIPPEVLKEGDAVPPIQTKEDPLAR
jgi:flagellar basal body-associated protein FliL